MHLRHLTIVSGLFFIAAAGEPAHAEAPDSALRASLTPVHIAADGSVTVDGTSYRDLGDYHRSEAFRADGRRCAAEKPTASFLAPTDCSLFSTTIVPEYEPSQDLVLEIPVVFHIVSDNTGQGDIPDSLIYSQIEILNEDFRALAGTPGAPGKDAAVQFALARIDPDGQPTTGINRYVNNQWYNDGNTMKPSLNWDPTRYLNIYTNTASGSLGYATFPAESAGLTRDGVVLSWPYVGRDAPMGDVYNQGRTATHEVGHYFGLYHTFEGGCSSPAQGYTSGDLIADTVPEFEPSFQCVEQQSACGGGPNPIHNYMDYTNDTCMDHFTAEQINRMRCSILNYRGELMNLAPVVDFSYLHQGLTVRLDSLSTDLDGTIVSLEWAFGDGAGSTEVSIEHTYASPGPQTVSLTVTDDRGSQITISRTIQLTDGKLADFTLDRDGLDVDFEDRSSDQNGPAVTWLWDFGDGGSSAEQHPGHEYAAPGVYPVSLTIGFGDGGAAVVEKNIKVEEGGCLCTVGHAGQSRRSPWLGGLFLGLLGALVLRRRRRA